MSEQPVEGLVESEPIDPAVLEELKQKSVSELTPDEAKMLEKIETTEEKTEAKEEVPSWQPTDEPPMEPPPMYPIEFFHDLIKDMRIDFDTRSLALDTVLKINATKDVTVDQILTEALQVENYIVTGQIKMETTTPPA